MNTPQKHTLEQTTRRVFFGLFCRTVIVLALCGSAMAAPSTIDRISKEILIPDSQQVLVVAHRGLGGRSTGAWEKYPENSLAAFAHSIEIGVDMIEVDVRKTKDGHLILMHDSRVERTTDGKGAITNLAFAEIRNLRLKTGIGAKDATLTSYKVPTLEEALLLVKGKCLINLDKVGSLIPECCEVLRRTDTMRQVVFKAGYSAERCAADYGQIKPPVLFMPIITHKKDWKSRDKHGWAELEPYSRLLRPCAFELVFAAEDDPMAAPETTALIKKNGSRVWINTLWDTQAGGRCDEKAVHDPDANWGWVISRGANIIQTDEAERLLQYLRSRNLHW